jgi:hypothetical protein
MAHNEGSHSGHEGGGEGGVAVPKGQMGAVIRIASDFDWTSIDLPRLARLIRRYENSFRSVTVRSIRHTDLSVEGLPDFSTHRYQEVLSETGQPLCETRSVVGKPDGQTHGRTPGVSQKDLPRVGSQEKVPVVYH